MLQTSKLGFFYFSVIFVAWWDIGPTYYSTRGGTRPWPWISVLLCGKKHRIISMWEVGSILVNNNWLSVWKWEWMYSMHWHWNWSSCDCVNPPQKEVVVAKELWCTKELWCASLIIMVPIIHSYIDIKFLTVPHPLTTTVIHCLEHSKEFWELWPICYQVLDLQRNSAILFRVTLPISRRNGWRYWVYVVAFECVIGKQRIQIM